VVETITLAQQLHTRCSQIEKWFAARKTVVSPYASFDVRYSGYKISVVDSNLFPAGFNHLNDTCQQHASAAFQRFFKTAKKILVIPESHTRNLPYFENLAALCQILQKAQLNVEVGSLLPDLHRPLAVQIAHYPSLIFKPLQSAIPWQHFDDFVPEMVLLNHDLSEGIPDFLKQLSIPIVPDVRLGWWQRQKSHHFEYYRAYAKQLAAEINIDPFALCAEQIVCEEIDFNQNQHLEKLQYEVAQMLQRIANQYQIHGIQDKPFVMMKADAGTYGMAVMAINDASLLSHLNHKQRGQMAHSKGGREVHRVLIQEGIYTQEKNETNNAAAEPVIYSVNHELIGGFYRFHEKQGADGNLNSPGMQFAPFLENNWQDPAQLSEKEYAYSVAARLALLAISDEIKELKS
jgi:glutamate--cysteine ligase